MNTVQERQTSKQNMILENMIQNIMVDVSEVIPALPKQAANDTNIIVYYDDTGIVWHNYGDTLQTFEDYNEAVEQLRDDYGYDITITLVLNNNAPSQVKI